MNRSDAWSRLAQCRRLQPDVMQVLVSADIVDALLAEDDWTRDPATGRSNSSHAFNEAVTHVTRLIRDSAYDLIAGRADSVAVLIVAQLAHKHGFRPSQAVQTEEAA